MASLATSRKRNSVRRGRRAAKQLAEAASALARDLTRAPRRRGAFFPAFAQAIGAPCSHQSAKDYALSLAAAKVVRAYWRHAQCNAKEQTIAFVARDPICASVVNALDSPDAELLAGDAKQSALELAHAVDHSPKTPLFGFLESLAASFDNARRKELGVYYTPQAVADYLVERCDAIVRRRFQKSRGLANAFLVDPAVGSGVFPAAAIRCAHAKFDAASGTTWSDFVRSTLLPHLTGHEIMPAAFVVANLLVAMELMQTGFAPKAEDRLRMQLGDALAEGARETTSADSDGLLPVIIGNPPYRGLSTNDHPWISRLLRGEGPDGRRCASYLHVDDEPLGERKTWLHDDYVKFFRLAHWQIERHGWGILALVTNHGFLDNPTFRGMRAALCETFDGIEVIDLGGNAKKARLRNDESVFETAQGMALTVAWRTGNGGAPCEIRRGNLRGSRKSKLAQLANANENPVATYRVTTSTPMYLFDVDLSGAKPEYEAGFRICDIMPVSTTAPVTARDGFIVDHDRNRLIERLHEFADHSISDSEIRQRYFQRGRSSRYPPGDTRGWKLDEARCRLAAETNWEQFARPCWYRPFDRRWIFWADWMIDWPRESIMRHMQRENLAIVCRRQSPRGRTCNFFGIVDDIVLDGFLRSDNRGSESVFPLYLYEDESCHPNFARHFIEACESAWNASYVAAGKDSLPIFGETFSSQDLLYYVHALFQSNVYQTRYEADLSVDFPRVLLAGDFGLCKELFALGGQLAKTQLLWPKEAERSVDCDVGYFGESLSTVAPGYPKYENQSVRVNRESHFAPVSEDAWEHKMGAHQVLRKWLKDRRGHELDKVELLSYRRCVSAVERTLAVKDKIDAAIDAWGGWPGAFLANSAKS